MNQKCENCGAELSGPFCSHCGQAARSRRGSFARMIAEASEDVLRFDSKFYHSLLHLLIKPGHLSKQFLDGKRVSILPPVRMYLVISLLFFFVFDIPAPDVRNSNVYIGNELIGKETPVQGQSNFHLISFDASNTDSAAQTWLENFISEKIEPVKGLDPQLLLDRIFKKLEDIVPNFLILFLPLFALILKLLYLFKRVLYFDHLIFALHFQSWLMITVLIIYGLAQFNLWMSSLSIFVPIYLAKAQKEVFQQTYWLIIPKTFFIILIYLLTLTMATVFALLTAIALL